MADARTRVTITVAGAGLAGTDLTVELVSLAEAEQWVRNELARERWEREHRTNLELAELRQRVKGLGT